LKNNFSQYRPFFTFLSKFLLFYVVFTIVYKIYLNQYDVDKNEVDSFTEAVANQTEKLMGVFVENTSSFRHEFEPSIKIFYNDKYVARVIEGCNAISVMILYAAFIFAFSTRWKKTFLYTLIGIIIIHFFNIIRIVLLCFSLYYCKEYAIFLHGTIFPLFIYGVVFLLWILWVTKFSGYAKRNS
jgi:exosortase family protein XrtF